MELNQNEELFINIIYPSIMDISKKNNILPSVLGANAILESSWGSTNVCQLYHNIFNMTADSNWTGKVYSLDSSKIYKSKNDCTEMAPILLKVYNSYSECINDYVTYISTIRRSKNGPLKYGTIIGDLDYKSVVDKLLRHGYLQDHLHKQYDQLYYSNTISIIEKYELYKWDYEFKKEVMEEENVVAKTIKRNLNVNIQAHNTNDQNTDKNGGEAKEVRKDNGIQEEANLEDKNDDDVIYRVRSSWEDEDSQLLATTNLMEAKTEACSHTGFKVYSGDDGTLIEDPWDEKEKVTKQYIFTPGKALMLKECPLYKDYNDTKPVMGITGTFYTYNSHIVNNKIRISKSNDISKLNGKDISVILGCIDVRDL